MKRSGFTMIELVFVIVILGILASVAIPKLAATRDDAEIAKSTSEVSSLIQDLGSYYTSRGSFHENNISQMTNVKLYNDKDGATAEGTTIKDQTAVVFKYIDSKRHKTCLDLTLNDINGTVTLGASTSDNQSIFCSGLASALSKTGMLKEYTFGGSSIYGN